MIRELLSTGGGRRLARVALVGLAVAALALPIGGSALPAADRSAGPASFDERTAPQATQTAEFPRRTVRLLIHHFVNRERVQRGLDPLALNETLSRIARYHSRDMARNNYFAHVSPDNETLADRYERFGFDCRISVGENRYVTGAENIAYTYYEEPVDIGNRTVVYSTPKQLARGIVNRWMNSTAHRKNVLRPYWLREGIGVFVEETQTGTRVYVTQNFC